MSEIIKVSKPKTKEQLLEEKVAQLEQVIDTMLGLGGEARKYNRERVSGKLASQITTRNMVREGSLSD